MFGQNGYMFQVIQSSAMGVGKHGQREGANFQFWELLWLNFEDFGDRFKNYCLEWGYELSLG